MKKLWILTVVNDKNFGYDCNYGAVVIAESEQEARQLFSYNACGCEPKEAWLDPKQTSCEELTTEYDCRNGIVITDFAAG